MYRVLLPVDDAPDRLERQLDAIARLPGRDELSVTVLHVHEEIDTQPDEAGQSVIDALNESIDDLQGTPETVGRAVDELADLGVEADTATVTGDPAERILETAAELDADAVLVAGRKRSAVGKALFGSVTQDVTLESERPVIVA